MGPLRVTTRMVNYYKDKTTKMASLMGFLSFTPSMDNYYQDQTTKMASLLISGDGQIELISGDIDRHHP